MHTYFLTRLAIALGLAVCMAESLPVQAQGLLLHPGSVFQSEFVSMTPGSQQILDRPSYGIGGGFLLPRPDVRFSFRVDLFEPNSAAPFWTYRFEFGPENGSSLTPTFGYAEIGSPWGQERGSVRLSYLSGPSIYLTDMSAYQTILQGMTYKSYQALLPVPEPSLGVLFGMSALIGFGLKRRREPTSPIEDNPDQPLDLPSPS